MADLHFYLDPICPFAWLTSRWVEEVAAARRYTVDWRFISLRIVNRDVDYDTHFPTGYEHGHTAGLRMLRVAAAVRADHGPDGVGRLYTGLGATIFDGEQPDDQAAHLLHLGTSEHVGGVLEAVGLPAALVSALDDESHDDLISAETEEALALTGRDVGTPILHFRPPDGVAFFGPVISRLPSGDAAVELWDHVIGLASFPGFAELKRSLREIPQLRAYGMGPDRVGEQQDWEAGHIRDAGVAVENENGSLQ